MTEKKEHETEKYPQQKFLKIQFNNYWTYVLKVIITEDLKNNKHENVTY